MSDLSPIIKDYDCFYAAVFEAENPALKSLPLAVQQKQIIVTCNYEARRRGLYKLQLVREAKRTCPDVIIVLGEDLTRFRNASKALYTFLKGFTWSQKVERLGFDEVFLDVTDIIDYNQTLLNQNDLSHSFFCLDRIDPTVGFSYDASKYSGHVFPATTSLPSSTPTSEAGEAERILDLRLRLGSHLAQHMRHQLEEHHGYTSTVGISTNKLLSKLVGNVNKPKGQTTLLPPYVRMPSNGGSNVASFLDTHDVGKIPGIGFKISQKIRAHVLARPAEFQEGLVYGGTKENVKVKDVRLFPGVGPELLESLLGGPGWPKGIGGKVWGLLNGADDAEVGIAKKVPSQISIEDSYIRLDTMEEVRKELLMLAGSLLKRMRLDLTEVEDADDPRNETHEEDAKYNGASSPMRWLAHPRTLRLTTRPRAPRNPDGTRTRSFNRISRSGPMPSFVFNFNQTVDERAEGLVNEALIPSFRKLHPEKSGWNLSLVNVCATNMAETATDDRDGAGRDIGRMFRRQEDVLKDWKIEDKDVAPSDDESSGFKYEGFADPNTLHLEHDGRKASSSRTDSPELLNGEVGVDSLSDGVSDFDDMATMNGQACKICGAIMPAFAVIAHERFHAVPD